MNEAHITALAKRLRLEVFDYTTFTGLSLDDAKHALVRVLEELSGEE